MPNNPINPTKPVGIVGPPPASTLEPDRHPVGGATLNRDPLFEDGLGGQYLEFGVALSYETDLGLRGAPLSGPPGTPIAIWRCHSGITCIVLTWGAVRIAGDPAVPHWDLGDNWVLTRRIIGVPTPIDFPDGERAVGLAGKYFYMPQVSPGLDEPIRIPQSVLRAPGGAARDISPLLFTRLLVGMLAPPSGGNPPPITF